MRVNAEKNKYYVQRGNSHKRNKPIKYTLCNLIKN